VHRTMIVGTALDVQDAVLLFEGDAVRNRDRSVCPWGLERRFLSAAMATLRQRERELVLFPIRDIFYSTLQTFCFALPHFAQYSSPPIFAFFAARPVINLSEW